MSKNDKWFFGFITLWIILTAGRPDLIDAVNQAIINSSSCEEDK